MILEFVAFAGKMMQSKCMKLYLRKLKMADRIYVMKNLLIPDWCAFRIYM